MNNLRGLTTAEAFKVIDLKMSFLEDLCDTHYEGMLLSDLSALHDELRQRMVELESFHKANQPGPVDEGQGEADPEFDLVEWIEEKPHEGPEARSVI